MGYKHVNIALLEKWAEKQRVLGVAPVEALLRHFIKETAWRLVVLAQTPTDCELLIKSEILGERRLCDAVREYFAQKLLLSEEQFADVVALKIADIEKDAADALEQSFIDANEAKAAQIANDTKAEDTAVRPVVAGSKFIEALDLSVRAFNVLKRGGVSTIAELISCTEEELLQFRNMNKRLLEEIKEKLAENGHSLMARSSLYMREFAEEPRVKTDGLEESFAGKDFSALLAEFEKIAPVINSSGTHEVFISQAYLFAINNGCGLTSRLNTLGETLTRLGLSRGGTGAVREYVIVLGAEEKDAYVSWKDFLSELAAAFIKNGSPIIACIDICEWLPRIKEARFLYYMRQLDKYTGKLIFVFRVPFLEKDALDDVHRVLSDVFTIRTVAFPPFTTEELIRNAKALLRGDGFVLSEDAIPVLTARISEEKRDGRFYGIKTLKKIIRETVYLKQLSIANGNSGDTTTISCSDIPELSDSYDATEKTGMEQLGELVGLGELKQQILGILVQIEAARKGKKQMPSIHMRFTGNPGTGKTTVARILGKILNEKGILRNGGFFEYSGRDFCGRYIGETAPKTATMCRDAYGSVLFIDEAYSLFNASDDSKDYGREALTTLIAEMENHRSDLLVIMAGYTDDMEALMKGNAGLKSRMPYTLTFPNYDRRELVNIFMTMAKNEFKCDKGLREAVAKYFEGLSDDALSDKEFSNARFVRNLYERTWGKALLRDQLSVNSGELTLKAEDFRQAASEGEFKAMLEKKSRRIGF